MFDVVAIGEMLIDFTSDSLQQDGYPTLDAHPGGGVLNYLATLAKYGKITSIISKVGNDAFGKMLIDTAMKCGINTTSVSITDKAFTTLAFVTRDSNGDRDFSFARKPGADTQLSFDDINLSIIDNTKVLHFSSVGMTTNPSKTTHKKVVEYAKEKGKIISYDPNYRPPLWKSKNEAKREIFWGISKCDILKISDNEIEFLFETFPEDAAKIILDNYDVKLVFITLGEKGCYFSTKTASGLIPLETVVTPIDTTGAGDIFNGSAMYGILKTGKQLDDLTKDDLTKIVRYACTTASLSTEKLGGVSSIPPLRKF